jgi:hypothetical protein
MVRNFYTVSARPGHERNLMVPDLAAQVMQADGKTPMAGSGPGGRATVDDLAREAAERFPIMFQRSADRLVDGDAGTPPKRPAPVARATIARAEFDKLPLYEQAAKIKSGVFPIDVDAREGTGGTSKKNTIARADFDKLSPYDQAAKIKAGVLPVDA